MKKRGEPLPAIRHSTVEAATVEVA